MQHEKLPAALLVCGGLALATLPATADELTEEVIVTANRVATPLSTVPNTVTVINEAELQRQLAIHNDISTVLGNLIPSYSPSRQKMTSAGETLRGREPLYLIDGVPQSNPLRNGGRDGHTIAPSMLERVEVLHGANAIHGLGAAGGIINLITKRPSESLEQTVKVDSSFQTESISESGDYGVAYSLSNSFGAADLLASVDFRSTGMAYDADGELIGVDNTQGDTMDSEALDLFLKTGYNWDDQRLELMVNRYDIEGNHRWGSLPGDVDADIPSGAIKANLPGEGARNKVTTASVSYENELFLGQRLRLQVYRQDFEATYGGEITPIATFQDPAYGADLIDQSQNNSEKLGLKLTLATGEIAGLPLSLVYGFDALQDETWQALIQTGRTWVPETRYDNYAPFLQAEFSAIEQLTVTAGVRHEESTLKVDDFTTLYSYGSQFVRGGEPDFSETLYNLGGTYQVTDAWRVFANYSEAYSMPDVGRVLRGINEPGQSVESFLDLTPILTENSEFGVEFDNGTFDVELSYYVSDSDFGQRLQRGADGIYTVMREKTEIDGLELRASWALGDSDQLGLRYAESEGRYDSNADGKVDSDLGGTNIAPDRLNLSWDRNWGDMVNTRLQLNYLLDRSVKNRSGTTVNEFDGYTTVDLSADVAIFSGVLSLSVQNLGNTDYYTYYSQSSPNDLRNFKGMGRSFSLAYQYSF